MSGITLFITLLAGGILAIVLLYIAYFALINFSPGKGKIKTDFKKMKGEITPWTDKLIPWNKEELELLSSTPVNQKIKRGMITTSKGVFNSIYHEPLIAYSYKKYLSSKENSILYARTSNHEFMYRTRKNKTTLYIDNQKVGVINEQGLLYGNHRKQLLAKVQTDNETLDLPIIIKDKAVGTLLKANKGSVNPRAFEFVKTMDNNEEAVFVSLAVLEMVKNSISK